jgi:hypothetical protein
MDADQRSADAAAAVIQSQWLDLRTVLLESAAVAQNLPDACVSNVGGL